MVYHFVKRLIDIVGSVLGLIVLLPILIIIAILIKVTSKGPVLVENSTRVGKKEVTFHMFKFRSMVKDAHILLRTDPKMQKLYEEYRNNSFKLESDPRVTPLGRFLRKTSLDELPQLLNVLFGDMSLVGPRAYYPDELSEQRQNFPNTHRFIALALSVKPGMTGLWQVSGRSEIGFEKRIQMDANYAESKSILLDLSILLRTPMAVFRGERNGHK